jgi:hypothetical protein
MGRHPPEPGDEASPGQPTHRRPPKVALGQFSTRHRYYTRPALRSAQGFWRSAGHATPPSKRRRPAYAGLQEKGMVLGRPPAGSCTAARFLWASWLDPLLFVVIWGCRSPPPAPGLRPASTFALRPRPRRRHEDLRLPRSPAIRGGPAAGGHAHLPPPRGDSPPCARPQSPPRTPSTQSGFDVFALGRALVRTCAPEVVAPAVHPNSSCSLT